MTTIAEALQQAVQRLKGHDNARLDAEVLLMHVLGKPRSHLHAWPERPLTAAQQRRLDRLLQRRAAGEPVAYLTGEREFWSLSLQVNSETLIPRPDTEILVELVLSVLPGEASLQIADLGTGSGAIALALSHDRPRWRLYALDRSAACTHLAQRNAQRLGLPGAVFLVGHWSAAFAGASLDAIVSNPPYVASTDPHLRRGDVRFEPLRALASGDDGLDDIRELVEDATRVLKPGAPLFLEHAPEQTEKIHNLLTNKNFTEISTVLDLAGRARATWARRPL